LLIDKTGAGFGVGVGVGVGVDVGVDVRVGIGVCVGVGHNVPVGDADGTDEGTGDTVHHGVEVGHGVSVGVTDGVPGPGVGVIVEVGIGVEVGPPGVLDGTIVVRTDIVLCPACMAFGIIKFSNNDNPAQRDTTTITFFFIGASSSHCIESDCSLTANAKLQGGCRVTCLNSPLTECA